MYGSMELTPLVSNPVFGKQYRVFYTDDTNKYREKILRLDAFQGEFCVFFNSRSGKRELIPSRFINRMEEPSPEADYGKK